MTFLDLFGLILTRPDSFGLVQTCSYSFGFVRTCLDTIIIADVVVLFTFIHLPEHYWLYRSLGVCMSISILHFNIHTRLVNSIREEKWKWMWFSSWVVRRELETYLVYCIWYTIVESYCALVRDDPYSNWWNLGALLFCHLFVRFSAASIWVGRRALSICTT